MYRLTLTNDKTTGALQKIELMLGVWTVVTVCEDFFQ